MNIAVASGKGGTGKTTVAVGLALALRDGKVRLLDCDVEEPNCAIFMNPEWQCRTTVNLPIPLIDKDKCNACGKCAEVCEFNAIAVFTENAIVFPELCHGCGGCALFCPEGAITETGRVVGEVEKGMSENIEFAHGSLRISEAMSPPLIRAVKRYATSGSINIIDCPPGASCPVIAALKDADYTVLVTEPTPFGLNDLELAVETVRIMGLRFGVVINRADAGDDRVRRYCEREEIEILLEIPEDRRIAEAYSTGKPLNEAAPEYAEAMQSLAARLTAQEART